MPRYLIEAIRRTAFQYERIAAHVFDADDIAAAQEVADAWLSSRSFDATSITNACLICGDLIIAEKDAELTKWHPEFGK
jgi:hypothetical protein